MASRNLCDLRDDYHWREMWKLISLIFTSSRITMFELTCQCAKNFIDFLLLNLETSARQAIQNIMSIDMVCQRCHCHVGSWYKCDSWDSFNHPNNNFYLLGKKANMNLVSHRVTFAFLMCKTTF